MRKPEGVRNTNNIMGQKWQSIAQRKFRGSQQTPNAFGFSTLHSPSLSSHRIVGNFEKPQWKVHYDVSARNANANAKRMWVKPARTAIKGNP